MEDKYDKDGENAFNIADFANTIETILSNEKAYIKQIRFYAKMRGEKYKALIDEGFSEEQALVLVRDTQLFG